MVCGMDWFSSVLLEAQGCCDKQAVLNPGMSFVTASSASGSPRSHHGALLGGHYTFLIASSTINSLSFLTFSVSSVASHKASLLKVAMSPFPSPDISSCFFYGPFCSSRFVFRVPACTSTHITLAHSLLCEPIWVPAWGRNSPGSLGI